MADKEIGLIQIRNDKQRNLPTALEHAELALTTDEGRMFIGLPATVTPASLVAGRRKNTNSGSGFVVQGSGEENIEILTEFSPQHVFDRVLYKPQRVLILANSSVTLQIPYTNRVFIDYVAFPDTLNVLESGSAQIAVFDDPNNAGQSKMILSQQNNTNDAVSDPYIEINAGTLSLTGTLLSIEIENNNTETFNFEYTTRGWGASQ